MNYICRNNAGPTSPATTKQWHQKNECRVDRHAIHPRHSNDRRASIDSQRSLLHHEDRLLGGYWSSSPSGSCLWFCILKEKEEIRQEGGIILCVSYRLIYWEIDKENRSNLQTVTEISRLTKMGDIIQNSDILFPKTSCIWSELTQRINSCFRVFLCMLSKQGKFYLPFISIVLSMLSMYCRSKHSWFLRLKLAAGS